MIKSCIWCWRELPLVKNKRYCEACKLNMKHECIRCHRPFPTNRCFNLSKIRCDACQRKYAKEKRNYYKNKGSCCKREEKVETKTKMDTMSTKTISKLYENASSEGEQSSEEEEEEGAESSATEEQKTPPPSPLPIALNIKKKGVKKQTTKNKNEHSTKKKLRLIRKPRKRECT
jgi:hypothetical protein